MATRKFEKLLEPYHIGSLKIKNRMVKSGAAARYWGTGENQVSDAIKHYYEAFARGGIGLLIAEGPLIEPVDSRMRGNYRVDEDKYVQSVREFTEIIHKHDCPVFVQLNHTANWQKSMAWRVDPSDPNIPRGASPVCVKSEMDNNNQMPREITVAEIQDIVDKFATTAVQCQKSGFDGIEINAASTHLFHSFLSPFWNKRQDDYGCQSLENRARFLVETIKEMKKRLGQDYPVILIINGIEIGSIIEVENSECLTAEDSRGIARILQEAGADAIQIRSQWLGRHDSSFLTDHLFYPETPIPLKSFPKELYWGRRGAGANMLLSARMKKVLDIPVMTVSKIDHELGEKMLRKGMTDFICMTRRLIADPELPNKIASGKLDDIAPCTSCTTCKVMGGHRRCRINATIGTDQEYTVSPSENKKIVMVVGGGPAGMEAARVSALRGHEVILYEKSHNLGGLLPMAALVKGLEIECLPAIVRYLKGQVIKLGVKIRLGKNVTPSTVENIKPDVVILATGGIPFTPEIQGINNKKVVSSTRLHGMLKLALKFIDPQTLRWLTKFWMPVGKRVVIIGGGINGCELAEFLVKRGRIVTIVETADKLGEGMVNHLRLQLLWWFRKKGVTMITGIKEYVEINDNGLVVLMPEGYKRTIEADSIIPAIPMKPDTGLFRELEGKVNELYTVGDCNEPKLIVDAIADGFRVGRSI